MMEPSVWIHSSSCAKLILEPGPCVVQECFGNASDSLIMLLFAESYQDPALTKRGGKETCWNEIPYRNSFKQFSYYIILPFKLFKANYTANVCSTISFTALQFQLWKSKVLQNNAYYCIYIKNYRHLNFTQELPQKFQKIAAYHFICQNAINTIFIQWDHPVQTSNLIIS